MKTASYNYLDGIEAGEYLKRKNNLTVIEPISAKTSENEEELLKNIRKRSDGRYEARKMINGYKINIIKRNLEECKKAFKQALKNLFKPEIKKTPLKFYEYCINYYKIYKEKFVSPETAKDIVRKYEKVKDSLIDIPLKQITTEKLQIFLNKFENNRQKEILIVYLNAVLVRAVKDKIITYNPMEDVKKPPKIKNVRKPFTFEEQKMLFEKLKGKDIEYEILFFALTGIRKNEYNHKEILKNIQADNTLKIKSEKKRGKEVFRYIDLSIKTIELIKANINKFKNTPDSLARKFRELLNEMKISKFYGLHTLRHTFATNHLYLGTPERVLQEWLGHEDLDITKKHYLSIDRSLSKEKIKELYKDLYYYFN